MYQLTVEPYLDNKMSSANRKQIKELLESVWQTISEEISDSRNLTDTKINEIAENLEANTPQKAIKSGLINEKEFHKLTDPKKMIGPH